MSLRLGPKNAHQPWPLALINISSGSGESPFSMPGARSWPANGGAAARDFPEPAARPREDRADLRAVARDVFGINLVLLGLYM